MGSFKFYATLAGMLAIGTTAQAADLLPPPPPLPIPIEVGGGWYLRGDVGVSNYQASKIRNPSDTGATFFGEDYGSGAFAGIGVGYQFSNWFRADVTGEYRFSTGFRTHDYGYFYDGGGNYVKSNEKEGGSYNAGVFLVNGYFDIGTWYGITPFIGAGVGYAYHQTHGWDTDTVNVATSPFGYIAYSSPSGGTIKNNDKGDFAWALHAGLAYDVSPNFKVELAYRYLNLGDVKTGVVNCYCGQTYSGFTVKDLESHDIKLGMRWLLGGPVIASAPEPYGPIIRKY